MGFSVYRTPFIYPRLEAFQEVLKLGVLNVPSLIGNKNKQEQNLRILQVVPINNSRARGPFNHDTCSIEGISLVTMDHDNISNYDFEIKLDYHLMCLSFIVFV